MRKKRRIAGRRWERLKAQVLVEENYICHLCGNPGANTADHLIPIKYAPELEFVRSNLHAAHQLCNNKRGAKPLQKKTPVITSQSW